MGHWALGIGISSLSHPVIASRCLGQCGNGPMVLVLPDMIWYSGIQPDEVSLLVEHHLLGGQIVKQMLYYRFHPQKLN